MAYCLGKCRDFLIHSPRQYAISVPAGTGTTYLPFTPALYSRSIIVRLQNKQHYLAFRVLYTRKVCACRGKRAATEVAALGMVCKDFCGFGRRGTPPQKGMIQNSWYADRFEANAYCAGQIGTLYVSCAPVILASHAPLSSKTLILT